jgi:acyl-homoserine lactone acylase PvdQ
MAPDGENFRGINAARLLSSQHDFTIDKMIATGYNRQLAAFEILIPALIDRFQKNVQPSDSLYNLLSEPVNILKQWGYGADENSVATTLAIEWAERLPVGLRNIYINDGEKSQVETTQEFVNNASANDLLLPLANAIADLKNKHGDWRITWGTINRYQRISSDIEQQYKDDASSYPIAFTSALWGTLPAYVSKYFPGTKKRYGVSGNSFVCAVEFGKKIKAKSLLAGGNSGNEISPHFTDQLGMYTKGKFKEVLFYKEDVLKHVEKIYHPGE